MWTIPGRVNPEEKQTNKQTSHRLMWWVTPSVAYSSRMQEGRRGEGFSKDIRSSCTYACTSTLCAVNFLSRKRNLIPLLNFVGVFSRKWGVCYVFLDFLRLFPRIMV